VLLATLFLASHCAIRPQAAVTGVGRNYGALATETGFTENRGQWDSQTKFRAQTGQVDLSVTPTGIVYNWHKPISAPSTGGPLRDELASVQEDCPVGVEFVGATGLGKVTGEHQLPGIKNYYFGKVRANRVKSFAKTTIQDLYPGIDLVTYIDEEVNRPRYDLVVHPGADPNRIKMRFTNAKNLKVTNDGTVQYDTPFGQIRESRQMAYQKADNGPDFRFFPAQVKNPDGTVSFDTAGCLKDRALVIDPVVWATYLGGSDGSTRTTGIKVDSNQNVYVSGVASNNAFAAKFDASGNCLWTTYYGGAVTIGRDVAFGASGSLLMVGTTTDRSLPVQSGSVFDPTAGVSSACYLAKFDTSGTLVGSMYVQSASRHNLAFPKMVGKDNFCTIVALEQRSTGQFPNFLQVSVDTTSTPQIMSETTAQNMGTFNLTNITGLAADKNSNFFITGDNDGTALQGINQSGFDGVAGLIKFTPGFPRGSSLPINITDTGRTSAKGVAVDATGNVYVIGEDSGGGSSYPYTTGALSVGSTAVKCGVITKFSNNLRTVLASCRFGGPDSGTGDYIAIGSDGNPVVVVEADGTQGIPLTWDYFSGRFSQIFLAKLSSDLTTELYGSYLGIDSVTPTAFAMDSLGAVYLAGTVTADVVPTTSGAFQTTKQASTSPFLLALNPTVTPGLQKITSDRGATPNLAGGVGKQVNVSVYFAEPAGTNITLSSSSSGVYINGSAIGTSTVTGSNHVATFAVTADDVASATAVTLTASDGTNQMSMPMTIQPFIRSVVVRSPRITPGTTLTVYVLPYEVPATDQTVNIAMNPALLSGTPNLTIKGIASGQQISGSTSTTVNVGDFDTSQIGVLTASLVGGASSQSSSLQLTAPVISTLVFDTPQIDSEQSANLSLTMSSPRLTDQTYTFASSNPAVAGDVSIFVPGNSTTGSVTVATNAIFSAASTASATFSNTTNGSHHSAALKVNTNRLVSASGDATVVEGDTFLLNASTLLAMHAPQNFTVTSTYPDSIPALTMPSTVDSNALAASVPTNSVKLAAPRTARMSVQWLNGGTPSGGIKFFNINVLPLVTSVTLDSLTIKGGQDITGTVTLAEANNTASPSFSLVSSNANAFFDATAPAVVPTGMATTIPFAIHTKAVTRNTVVVITLPTPLGHRTKQFNVTLTAG